MMDTITRDRLDGKRRHLAVNPLDDQPISITAGELEVGMVAVEKRCQNADTVNVYLDVTYVERERFTHYTLSDGSERSLAHYVEVTILG